MKGIIFFVLSFVLMLSTITFSENVPQESSVPCTTCTYVADFLRYWMRFSKNSNSTDITNTINVVCNVINPKFEEACNQFVETNRAIITQHASDSLTDSTASMDFCFKNQGFCSSEEEFKQAQAFILTLSPAKPERDGLNEDLYCTYNLTYSCGQMCDIVTNSGLPDTYGQVESMICVAYLESRWEPTAYSKYCQCYGLWQFIPHYFYNDGNGQCPGNLQGFLTAQGNADCMAYVVETYGFYDISEFWSQEPMECMQCVFSGFKTCTSNLACYYAHFCGCQ